MVFCDNMPTDCRMIVHRCLCTPTKKCNKECDWLQLHSSNTSYICMGNSALCSEQWLQIQHVQVQYSSKYLSTS